MEKIIRLLGIVDWLVAIGSIAVGLYLKNGWVIGSGVLGLGIAYLQPAVWMKKKMEKWLVRKAKPGEVSTALVQHDEAFYADVLGNSEPKVTVAAVSLPQRTYASPSLPYAGTYIGRRKHNLLRPEHFNLYGERSGATRY